LLPDQVVALLPQGLLRLHSLQVRRRMVQLLLIAPERLF
jgi:hypothetical protein